MGEPYAIQKVARSSQAMVVTAHPLATEIGVEILERGGNAVDAAVAVQFALAVVYPIAGNIGGGGFMLIRDTSGETSALDFREKAPMAAYRDLYLDSMGQVVEGMSITGHLSVGVPGAVDGMWKAHQRYGRLPWNELLAPAVALASEGILLTSQEAAELNAEREVIRTVNAGPVPFIQDIPWRTGDRLVQTELGATLQRIADAGRDEF
ncbi:MAG TPA: gamma-glutamyltransferase, partial [Saprospiraceae bacterium]|nr:gamma-glutamyltransferase [Saprospiraceae bacterium]